MLLRPVPINAIQLFFETTIKPKGRVWGAHSLELDLQSKTIAWDMASWSARQEWLLTEQEWSLIRKSSMGLGW